MSPMLPTVGKMMEDGWSKKEAEAHLRWAQNRFKCSCPIPAHSLYISEKCFHTRLDMALRCDGRTAQEIAREMGVAPSQLTRWRTHVNPSPQIVEKLVRVLDIDAHQLITGQEFVT